MTRKYVLLQDLDVKRWYGHLARSSESTADTYLRILGRFCEIFNIKPKELVKLTDCEIRNMLLDYISALEDSSDYNGSYFRSIVSAVRSWLRFNNRDININIKMKSSQPKVAQTERVPTKDELRKILSVADIRAKVAIGLMAFSGLRPEVIGNYRGTDGLKVRDIPDLKIYGSKVEFVRVPAMVIVRPNLNKAGHQYFTFLGEEGCEYLKDYLNYRLRQGEILTENSPIIAPKPLSRRDQHLATANVSEMIRKAIRLAGFDWRPYVLRHYFDTYMLMAEANGIIIEDYRTFWMGHKGNIEHQYTTNKHRLPENIIEDMRVKYTQAVELFLETKVKEFKLEPKQKVVTADEIEKYLEMGWEYVTTLPDGRIIVKRS